MLNTRDAVTGTLILNITVEVLSPIIFWLILRNTEGGLKWLFAGSTHVSKTSHTYVARII